MGDVVYTAAAIDPAVVAAVDFSRAESLEILFDFSAFAQRTSEFSGEALRGAENNLCGYVAEQIVAARLVEKGHQVSLPETPNNLGYDLLVDGAQFQVKCLSKIDGLHEHFGKYSEIPVIANAEPAVETTTENAPAWAGKVFFVEGYDYGTTRHIMTETIKAGGALDDLDVPVFALAVSAARNVHGWWKGTIALADLPWEVTVDGAVRGGLAAAGGFTGKTLGLLVFGPAGAVVFGGLGAAAALLGSTSARRIFEGLLPERSAWLERTESASRDLLEALQRTLTCKRRELDRKIGLLPDRTDNEIDWLRRRLRDDQVFIAERQVRVTELMGRDMPAIDKAREALRAVHDSGVHPWTVRADIGCVLTALDDKPPVRETITKVMDRQRSRSNGAGNDRDAGRGLSARALAGCRGAAPRRRRAGDERPPHRHRVTVIPESPYDPENLRPRS